MSVQDQPKTVTITLDGHEFQAAFREPVLAITRRYGIEIPTLCDHEALEPAGACRLCLVEVEHRGRKKIVTACNFPVEDGMVIRTATDEVMRSRRMTAESLLARCPEVPAIREVATRLGVETTRFVAEEDTCILCSLCTRVCETYVTSAIATIERGTKKFIGTFGGDPPEECVGCGACAEICPTDHIEAQRVGTEYTIWGRSFPLAVCEVDAERCRACGACEEACPWSIPRVVLRKDAPAVAAINAEVCKACGVCVAACPSGAITQPGATRALPAPAETDKPVLVVACGRSNLCGPGAPAMPAGASALEMPCAGSVSQAQLLGALASGFAGVLVLGRHEATCRLDGAEDHGRQTVARVDRLAELAGLGAGRVAFVEPAPGRRGPVTAIEEFAATLAPSAISTPAPPDLLVENQDAVAGLLQWLAERDELVPDPARWLAEHDLPVAQPGQPALLAAAVPYLDVMLEEWTGTGALASALGHALRVLAELGIEAGVAVGGFRGGEKRLVESLPGTTFYSLCGGCGGRLGDAGGTMRSFAELLATRGIELALPAMGEKVAAARSAAEGGALSGFGAGVVPISEAPVLGHALTLKEGEQDALLARLAEAETAGARALYAATPVELYQLLIAQRRGGWRRTHVEPLLAATIAAAGLEARAPKTGAGA